MEGDVEALPMNESSVSDIEMTVDLSIHYGFMVDWGLFLLAARWSAAFLSASPASVVAASRSCGSALLVSWLCLGTCFQPCLWFIRQWIDVSQIWSAAAITHLFCKKSMLAAAAFASTFPVVLVGNSVSLVGAFAVSTIVASSFWIVCCWSSKTEYPCARRQQWTLHVKHVESDFEQNLCTIHVSRPTPDNSGAAVLELDCVRS